MPTNRSPVAPLKRQLAKRIAAHVRRMGVTQAQAAGELDLTQPRLTFEDLPLLLKNLAPAS